MGPASQARWWREPPVPDGSDPLEDRPGRHRSASTHGDERAGAVGALELVERGGDQPGPGGADRVPQCDRAAVDVGALERCTGLLRPGQDDGRKRLVDLEQVEVVEGETGALEHSTGRVDGTVEV